MRVSVIFPDKMIGFGGVFYNIPSLTASDPNYSVIQWYDSGYGVIEVFTGDPIRFEDQSLIEPYIALWQAANTAAMAPAPTPTLAQAQATAIADCISYANAFTAKITNAYPDSEVASWPAQEAEAKLVQAGQAPAAPSILQALVTAANNPTLTVQALATAVLAKAAAYHQIVGAVQAIRTQAQSQIGAATDASQIPAIIAGLKQQADAAAAQLGL